MRKSPFSDYQKSVVAAHLGWWGTAVVVSLRAFHVIPQAAGTVALLFLGLGVTASLALSRMKLGQTITQVFQTGLSVAVSLSTTGTTPEGSIRAAVFRTDLNGTIQSVEQADVIGWPNSSRETLEGRNMDSIIPDRFLRINHAALTSYREASAGGTDEAGVVIAFNVPLRGHDGKERAFRMTIARLGDTLIKTVVPVSEKMAHMNG